MRRGISLLEVLISVFVILVGLLGVIALIPVGHRSTMKALEHDRAAALGRMAMHHVKVADLLDATQWRLADGTDFDETQTGTQAFALDPLYAAHNVATTGANWLPLATDPAVDPTIIPRMSVFSDTTTMVPMAERLCIGEDDLVFTSAEPESRPVASGHKGEFSWFLTVNPPLSANSMDYANKPSLDVSVAICKSRDMESDPLAVPVTINSDDEFSITLPADGLLPNLRRGGWVLVCSDSVTTYAEYEVAHWYRIVAITDDTDPLVWHLSVAGPEWPYYVDSTGTRQRLPATAVLFEDVVGVYTETIAR